MPRIAEEEIERIKRELRLRSSWTLHNAPSLTGFTRVWLEQVRNRALGAGRGVNGGRCSRPAVNIRFFRNVHLRSALI